MRTFGKAKRKEFSARFPSLHLLICALPLMMMSLCSTRYWKWTKSRIPLFMFSLAKLAMWVGVAPNSHILIRHTRYLVGPRGIRVIQLWRKSLRVPHRGMRETQSMQGSVVKRARLRAHSWVLRCSCQTGLERNLQLGKKQFLFQPTLLPF